jgi:chemotaxis protein MotB
MALRARRGGGNGLEAWPGYVDALSTLLMVIIFVLLVFVLGQAFLSVSLAGRSKALDKATQELTALTTALALEHGRGDALQASVAGLSRDLATAGKERDSLTEQLASIALQMRRLGEERDQTRTRLEAATTKAEADARDAASARSELAATQRQITEMRRQIADLDRVTRADKATIEARVSDLARLADQTRALTALRDELESRVKDAAARAMTEAERARAAQSLLAEEKSLGDSARAQIALMNRQIEQLREQLSAVANSLDLAKKSGQEKDAEIANLGQKLNVALAERVEELKQYRSEFFGRLRSLLANRPGIQVVGDRFVFQSEVLFGVGSAEPTQAGIAQVGALAASIKDLVADIPADVQWMLRVDGHTDAQPMKGGAFASNWELSAARAITVVKLLIAEGVPATHLAATGFGEFQPIASGETPDALAKNRRIELRLTDR